MRTSKKLGIIFSIFSIGLIVFSVFSLPAEAREIVVEVSDPGEQPGDEPPQLYGIRFEACDQWVWERNATVGGAYVCLHRPRRVVALEAYSAADYIQHLQSRIEELEARLNEEPASKEAAQ